MHLLHFVGPSQKVELKTFCHKSQIPPYAILSHTWLGDQEEEVTYEELRNRSTRDKAGWHKILFCLSQALQDGLHYAWVDTCCINKNDQNELTTAINSMYWWYQQARKCYVYLADVDLADLGVEARAYPITWQHAFSQSRWWTRGWTLQELLAPPVVEFYSADDQYLCDKISMEDTIHEIAGIPIHILRGGTVNAYGMEERLSWVQRREITVEEDRAYCMIGIMGISMPLIYGEGERYALQRLMSAVRADALSGPSKAIPSAASRHEPYYDGTRWLFEREDGTMLAFDQMQNTWLPRR